MLTDPFALVLSNRRPSSFKNLSASTATIAEFASFLFCAARSCWQASPRVGLPGPHVTVTVRAVPVPLDHTYDQASLGAQDQRFTTTTVHSQHPTLCILAACHQGVLAGGCFTARCSHCCIPVPGHLPALAYVNTYLNTAQKGPVRTPTCGSTELGAYIMRLCHQPPGCSVAAFHTKRKRIWLAASTCGLRDPVLTYLPALSSANQKAPMERSHEHHVYIAASVARASLPGQAVSLGFFEGCKFAWEEL